MMTTKAKLAYLAFISLLIFLYFNGLSGPFIYDDNSNLAPLSVFSDTDLTTTEKLQHILTTNASGPLGRPVSMLSFTLNAEGWPNDAYYFKLTNLLLHCLTGLFVYLICVQILNKLDSKRKQNGLIALIASFIWLAHPLQVSTVLYVVQRMEILSGLFGLASTYVYLRYVIEEKTSRLRYLTATGFVAIILFIGVLSKEDAILFLLILPVLGHYLGTERSDWNKRYTLFLYTIPALVVTGVLLHHVVENMVVQQGHLLRDFSPLERLMTQPWVLLNYLKQIYLPNYSSMSIFHDDIELLTSLTDIKTMTSIGLLLILLVVPFLLRNKLAIICTVWFFIIHSVEASTIPLYLYFEHRNYVASIGPILLGVYCLYLLSQKLVRDSGSTHPRSNVFVYMAIVLLSVFSFQTYKLSNIWSDEQTMYMNWLDKHPYSPWTFFSLLNYYQQNNQLELAARLSELGLSYPEYQNNITLILYNYTATCVLGRPNETRLDSAINNLDKLTFSSTLPYIYKAVLENTRGGSCRPSLDKLITIAENSLSAPISGNKRWNSDMEAVVGHLYLLSNNPEKAIYHLKRTSFSRHADNLTALIHMLILSNDIAEAEKYLLIAKDLAEKNPIRFRKLQSDIFVLEKILYSQGNQETG
jgi:hypothetical protein